MDEAGDESTHNSLNNVAWRLTAGYPVDGLLPLDLSRILDTKSTKSSDTDVLDPISAISWQHYHSVFPRAVVQAQNGVLENMETRKND